MITDDEVMRVLERANPARVDDAITMIDAAGYFDALRTRSTTVTLIDTQPNRTEPTSRHRWPIIIAAAGAVAAIAAGVLVLATRDDATEPQIPADQPTTVAPDPATAAQQIARGFVDAYGAFDADRAIGYVTDDVIAAEWATPEDFRLTVSLLEAQQTKQLLGPCEEANSADGVVVRCPFDVHSFGSDQLGLGPFSGNSWQLTVRDGQIVALVLDTVADGQSSPLWVQFRRWVETEHPDDVDVLFDPTGDTGANLTEESIRRWEQRIQDYVDDQRPVGFIGLPPEGATPSTPERGELVLHLYGGSTVGPRSRIYVYADGRLIWWREDVNRPGSANADSTGLLEQRLTPEGVEVVRSEILSTGLFDENLVVAVNAHMPCVNTIGVRNQDRLVLVRYINGLGGSCPSAQQATQEQAEALLRLDGRLTDPQSWLPATAWEDQTIRAYVPSSYAVCRYVNDVNGASLPDQPLEQLLALLPAPAAELLRGKQTVPEGPDGPALGGRGDCLGLTTHEARLLNQALSDGGFEQDEQANNHRLQYQLDYPGQEGALVNIVFEPVFPDGTISCGCG